MVYELNSNTILVEVNRTAIVDISEGDELTAPTLSGATYRWTQQDSQFVESNPDARLFLRFEKRQRGQFEGSGLVVIPEEVY